ncbi:hypothetical protein P7C70_g924, partial [Phenoliferia sp. Uapishka_3]
MSKDNSNPTLSPKRSRSRFNHPFAKTSPGPQLSPLADSSRNRDSDSIAVATDGSFVETTSSVAAKALAKWYSEQEGEEYAVQSSVRGGKTFYRIRPRSRPPSPTKVLQSSDTTSTRSNSPVFARSSIQPPPPISPSLRQPSITVSHATPPRLLRVSKSIPLLRHIQQPSSPSSLTGSPPPSLLHPYPALRKSGSTPSLSSLALSQSQVDTTAIPRAKATSADGAGYQVDILGRLLGWDPPKASARGGGTGGREQRKGLAGHLAYGDRDRYLAGSARMRDLPGISVGSSIVSEAEEGDVTDLPEDCAFLSLLPTCKQAPRKGMLLTTDHLPLVVDELASIPEAPSPPGSSSVPPSPSLLPSLPNPERPPIPRSKSHPFGTGVRVPSSRTSSTLRVQDTSTPVPSSEEEGGELRTMREVASSDSIRTAKADDDLPLRRLKRFQDPTVFDFLQSLELAPVFSLHHASNQSSAHPLHANAPHHARLPSSTSVTSSLSDLDPHDIVVSAVPGDDPRFVLWGLKDPELLRPASVPGTPNFGRRGSIVPVEGAPVESPPPSSAGSPAPSSTSKRWSLKDRRSHPSDTTSSPATSVRDSIGSTSADVPNRVLMAATVERWVAELTSQISPELLTGFFLTYRTFVRPLDLFRLLSTRFDWAMATPTGPEDDAARRIVRVRTFVVIRHWLLNHFADDFVPDRKLRTAVTDWLNAESKLERIRASPKDHRLIKGLKKIVRRLKETHVAIGPADAEEGARLLLSSNPNGRRRAGSSEAPPLSPLKEPSDEDVDLEIDHARTGTASTLTSPSRARGRFESAFAKIASPASADSTEFSTLRSPNLSFPLPNSQNAIARSFTSALGTFGRFKRMLGNRAVAGQQQSGGGGHPGFTPTSSTNSGDFGSLELEESATGDLLYAKRGLASFLEYYNIPLVPGPEDTTVETELATPSLDDSTGSDSQYASEALTTPSESDGLSLGGLDDLPPEEHLSGLGLGQSLGLAPNDNFVAVHPARGAFQFDSSAINNFGPSAYDLLDYPPSSSAFLYGRPQSARIELDDVDLSDEDDDVVEVKRTLKRLPGAQNLRIATTLKNLTAGAYRDSIASVMSYGTPNPRVSYGGPERESVAYVDDSEGGPEGVQVVANFVLEGIDSDDDEPGDVEAALRRLEGLVDDTQEREKAKRVARQMEKSDRLAKAKLSTTGIPGEGDAFDEDHDNSSLKRTSKSPSSTGSIPASITSADPTPPILEGAVITNSPEPSPSIANSPFPSPKKTRTRSFSHRTLTSKPTASKIFSQRLPLSAVPSSRISPPTHRSFILHCRTEVLAQQFCLIERDMFRLLSWQELVGGGWRDHTSQNSDVLDWEAYIKERRKLDLAARENGDRTPSALQALIARYNLTSNWVASEIVLTVNLDERVALMAKFIRLAFKCYCQNNFQTMTQIIHGLGLPDIERLRKTWARVPLWEMRKYRGMATFVSPVKNFKHLREVQTALIDEYGPAGQRGPMHRPPAPRGIKSPPPPTGCIPFLGIFLKDLASMSELPTFLDPSSPTTPAEVNAVGDLERIADPTAFFSLRALPEGLRLRPLVNVHKFRMIADEVQLVLAFQEFSEKYLWEPESSLYLRTLKIRCLDSNTLRECSIRLTQA